ncbi:hypothetical protein [Streptomyces sp. NPDC019890]
MSSTELGAQPLGFAKAEQLRRAVSCPPTRGSWAAPAPRDSR